MKKSILKFISALLLVCMSVSAVPSGMVYGAEQTAAESISKEKTAEDTTGYSEGSKESVEDESEAFVEEEGERTVVEESAETSGNLTDPEVSADAETSDDAVENTVEEETADTDNGSVKAEAQNENASENNTLSEQPEAEELLSDIEYIYIESPYLETPGTQRVAISFVEVSDFIDNVSITVKNSDGTEEKWESVDHTDDLYLFEKSYTSDSQSGIYEILSIQAVSGQTEQNLLAADLGIDAKFGVNEEYTGLEELQPLNGETEEDTSAVEATVVTIDENGQVESQNSIEEALSVASADAGVSVASSKARTTAPSNIVVALDPGHDSKHAGAQGFGLKEEELTLKIANYCKEELETYAGVTVYMTRTTAACPYPSSSSSASDIAMRADAAAAAGADIFVSFHLNSSTASGVKGAEVIIPNTNWKPEVADEGAELAQKIMAELTALGLDERSIYSRSAVEDKNPDGSAADYFAVQRHNKENGIAGIIIEHAFISNSSDVNNYLNTEEGLKKLGVADATGIAKYLGLSKGAWVQDENGWKYQLGDGYAESQWLTVNGENNYFNSQGYRVTGLCYIGSNRYYFDENGVMLSSSWIEVEGETYYLTKTGKAVTGLCYIGADRYYFNSDGSMVTDSWIETDGDQFYFTDDGKALTGLITLEGAKYYFNSDGTMLTKSWKDVGSSRYFFMSTGKAATGICYVGSGRYYFGSDGIMRSKSWAEVDGGKYYLTSTGKAVTGLRYIGSDKYYFNSDGTMVSNSLIEVNGAKYYFGDSGVASKGLCTIDGAKYYFNSDGSAVLKSWMNINGARYFFMSTGKAATGICYVGSGRYYFGTDGVMRSRTWAEVDGNKYYLTSTGKAVTGWCYIGADRYYFDAAGIMQKGWTEIDGLWYYFDSEGVYDSTPSTNSPANPQYLIAGETTVPAEELADFFTNRKKQTYPSFYRNSDAKTIEEFCQIYIEEAEAEGIRAEIAFVQAMLETGWLKFTGDVSIDQYNFAGIGTVGGGVAGATFPDVRTGIRAQIQHLKAYANTEELNNEVVDPRFGLVTRGAAPYVEWLGIMENPKNAGWAAGKNYGYNIMSLLNQI